MKNIEPIWYYDPEAGGLGILWQCSDEMRFIGLMLGPIGIGLRFVKSK